MRSRVKIGVSGATHRLAATRRLRVARPGARGKRAAGSEEVVAGAEQEAEPLAGLDGDVQAGHGPSRRRARSGSCPRRWCSAWSPARDPGGDGLLAHGDHRLDGRHPDVQPGHARIRGRRLSHRDPRLRRVPEGQPRRPAARQGAGVQGDGQCPAVCRRERGTWSSALEARSRRSTRWGASRSFATTRPSWAT